MKKIIVGILSTLGVVSIMICLAYGGYSFGYDKGWSMGYGSATDGTQVFTYDEFQNKVKVFRAIDDYGIIILKTKQMADLCEEKFQSLVKGDKDRVLELTGQITAINEYLNESLGKYTKDGIEILNK